MLEDDLKELHTALLKSSAHCNRNQNKVGIIARCTGCPAQDADDPAICHYNEMHNYFVHLQERRQADATSI